MQRLYTQPLVLASGNPGKLGEFKSLLAEAKITVISQSELKVPEPEETGLTFIENAILKAKNAALHTGLSALADDSGIAVDALHGKPGIYSARFAGPQANDERNNQKLLEALAGIPAHRRTARYHCVIALMRSAEDPTPFICHATWEGRITENPSGNNGFGYDPLFYLDEYQCTAAQLDPMLKNKISHRGKALAELLTALNTKISP